MREKIEICLSSKVQCSSSERHSNLNTNRSWWKQCLSRKKMTSINSSAFTVQTAFFVWGPMQTQRKRTMAREKMSFCSVVNGKNHAKGRICTWTEETEEKRSKSLEWWCHCLCLTVSAVNYIQSLLRVKRCTFNLYCADVLPRTVRVQSGHCITIQVQWILNDWMEKNRQCIPVWFLLCQYVRVDDAEMLVDY